MSSPFPPNTPPASGPSPGTAGGQIARKPPSPLGAALAAWVFPGAGYLVLRRPWPALFVVGGVLPLFLLGMALAGWENVNYERHPWYFILQAFAGVPTLVASGLTGDVTITRYHPYAAIGTLFTAVAGMLNLMAAADCWARCHRGDPEDRTKPGPGSADHQGDRNLGGDAVA